MKKVLFVPRIGIENMPGYADEILISIIDSDMDEVETTGDWRAILRLKFDDIDIPQPGLILFDSNHAKEIIEFLGQWDGYGQDLTFYAQCSAGISRSAAVAKFIAEYYQITQFNHNYRLYNKHVYTLLMETYYGSVYDFVRRAFSREKEQ